MSERPRKIQTLFTVSEELRVSFERAQFTAAPIALGKPESVDDDARVLRGISVITRGEALGHGLFVDVPFLDMLVEMAAGGDEGDDDAPGLKSRFAHPGFTDGIGSYLGRVRNLRRAGDRVVGDLYLAKSADLAPAGELATYVMSLAQEDPEAFGASIVFSRDVEAEEAELASWPEDDDGKRRSPDEMNTRNLRHARLASVDAVDIVDDPAANPRGLFRANRSNRNTPEAAPAQETKMSNTNDAPKPATLAELKSRFGSRPEFVLEQLEAGATLDQAEVAHLRLEVAEAKKAEADALAAAEQAKAEAEKVKREAASVTVTTSSGVDPINLSASGDDDTTSGDDFVTAAKRLARERGITIREALKTIARDEPQRYADFVDAPRVMAGARRTVAWGSLQPLKKTNA